MTQKRPRLSCPHYSLYNVKMSTPWLNRVVDKFANLTYYGSVKSDFNPMKCIDLFHCKELARVIGKWVKEK